MSSGQSNISARVGIIIIAGCLMALISMGVRSSFGLFVAGAPDALGVSSGDFGLALGWQNLLWGLMGAYAASLVDRFGPMWVLMAGAVMYGSGILGMLFLPGTWWTYLFLGGLTGGGVAATGFTIIAMTFGKLVAPEQRSWALGLGTAAASFGLKCRQRSKQPSAIGVTCCCSSASSSAGFISPLSTSTCPSSSSIKASSRNGSMAWAESALSPWDWLVSSTSLALTWLVSLGRRRQRSMDWPSSIWRVR
ncbi:MAG: hypothetical protein ACO3NE_07655 [Alphaproteobacteria bacterium]